MAIDLDVIKKHHEEWESEGEFATKDNVTAHLDRWRLLSEVERLTKERDEAIADAAHQRELRNADFAEVIFTGGKW